MKKNENSTNGKTKTERKKTASPDLDAPETSASAETNQADIQTETPADVVYTVNKVDGVITETTRQVVYETITELTKQTIDKSLDSGKVLPKGASFFSINRKKLQKFEKAKDVQPEQKDEQPETPESSETPEAENTPVSVPETENDVTPPEEAENGSTGDTGAGNDTLNKDSGNGSGEVPAQQYEGTENAKFEQGDKVININTGALGIVVFKDGSLKVEFTIDGKARSSKKLEIWRIATEAETEADKSANALVKKEPQAIQGEVVAPLTETEKAELAQCEKAILEAKGVHDKAIQAVENSQNIMAENLSVVRDKKLWRESIGESGEVCKSFKQYVIEVLGFNDKYGQNLAQIGDFRLTAKELTGGENIEDLSVNANNALLQGYKKIASELGLGNVEFHEIKPIIQAGFDVLGAVITDDDGNINKDLLKPQIITQTADQIREVVQTQLIEVDGEQMTVSEAREKGLMKAGFVDSVLETVSEGIKSKKQYIADNLNSQKEKRETPTLHKNNPSDATEVFKGRIPNLQVTCAKHGLTQIISIGNGVMQTACLCRWHIDNDTKLLFVYEVEGKRVVR